MPARPEPPQLWRSVFYPLPDYKYFAKPPDFATSPKIGELNLLKAAWMADASMLSYGRVGPDWIPVDQVKKVLAGAGLTEFDPIGDWSEDAHGTQGFFAFNDDFAILCFRGTEVSDWEDFATDLAAWPVEESLATEQPDLPIPSLRAVFHHNAPAVHGGFQAALNEVWTRVAADLAAYRALSPNEIFFTGHSLGAALATLAVARFGGGNASLYTVGSPRVGNLAFTDKVRGAATQGQFRLVDNHDLVTRVPPRLMLYEHIPGSLYQIDADGNVLDRTADPSAEPDDEQEVYRDLQSLSELRFPIDLDGTPPDDLYDHSPGRYCNRLWNTVL
jgi:hypothetical protein